MMAKLANMNLWERVSLPKNVLSFVSIKHLKGSDQSLMDMEPTSGGKFRPLHVSARGRTRYTAHYHSGKEIEISKSYSKIGDIK
jgi:hypothetical protein